MYRFALEKLYKWKTSSERKPLIINGGKQVGKTWLARDFGSKNYRNTLYVDLSIESDRSSVLCFSYDVSEIIYNLETNFNSKIDPNETLIIFDNIQDIPEIIPVLSAFYLNVPNYNLICISSVSCDVLFHDFPFSASDIDSLTIYPLSFKEFLIALGKQKYVDLLSVGDFNSISLFKNELIDLLKHYFLVGGMPEAVLSFSSEHNPKKVRLIQKNILNLYEQSFRSEINDSFLRLMRVWNCIPSQLAKEKKKFLYGNISDGARAREYESTISSLSNHGFVYKIPRVTVGRSPLHSYEDNKAFKLFLNDIGLLGAMLEIDPDIINDDYNIFDIFNGALTEQYVVQQLIIDPELSIFYYTNDNGTCEVDFLLDNGNTVIPLDVSSTPNLRAKSAKIYSEKFVPDISARTSLLDYQREQFLINIPLYSIENLTMEIKKSTDYLSDWEHFFVF